MIFPVEYNKILENIQLVDPLKYGSTRNYTDGAVTRLSPYISRGVISGKQVLETILSHGYEPHKIEKFIQELAWRDYWQQQWIVYKDRINEDLKHPQPSAIRSGLPANILSHQTGIEAIDKGIQVLYETGYMHNHIRMYLASVVCNVGSCHWKEPAQWMYYHLLDADWGSNALSWQWVCGANSYKCYYANQENINKYCYTKQHNTFLDVTYEEFSQLAIPEVLHLTISPRFKTVLPSTTAPTLHPERPTLIYNFYNLDPNWKSNLQANRILLLEPSVFEKYPVSQKSIDFCLALAKINMPEIQIWVAEFSELQTLVQGDIYFKEHPLNQYVGREESRTWITTVSGDYPSFFAFWKKLKKELF